MHFPRVAPSLSLVRFTLCAVVASVAHSALAAEAAETAYPISVIVLADPRHDDAGPTVPIADALAQVRMGYNSEGPSLRAALAARNGKTPPLIQYMGGFTTNHEDVLWLEKEYRRGIAMAEIAKLGADLDADAREFVLTEPRDGELAVKASTADGLDLEDRSKYCYWLRIGDELMKVMAVDAASGRVTVERGFDRSQRQAHKAGAMVFGPVYLGNRAKMTPRASSAWPGGTSRIRYAVDPRHPEAQAFKARCVVEAMRRGYDGAWWDTFEAQPFNLCDVVGRDIKFPWDFSKGDRYDLAGMVDAMASYTRKVRALVQQQMGVNPVIYANNVSPTYARGAKDLMKTAAAPDLLDGYCFEDSYLEVKVGTAGGRRNRATRGEPTPPPATYERRTGSIWLRNIGNQADAANSKLPAICMSGAAGYLAGALNTSLSDYDELLRYAYASYLLTVTADRATSFGLPLLIQLEDGKGVSASPLPKLVFAQIGDPTQPNDLAALKVKDAEVYARQFTRGFVAVYPAHEGHTVDVPVPAGLVDAQTGRPVSKLTLSPGDAAVLVRK